MWLRCELEWTPEEWGSGVSLNGQLMHAVAAQKEVRSLSERAFIVSSTGE